MRRTAGFTAIEVLAATVLLALALVPLLGMEVRTGTQAGFLGGQALAMVRAHSLVDASAALGFAQLAARAERGAALAECGANERVTFERIDVALGCVRAEVSWSAGSDARVRRVSCFRMVRRLDQGWTEPADTAFVNAAD